MQNFLAQGISGRPKTVQNKRYINKDTRYTKRTLQDPEKDQSDTFHKFTQSNKFMPYTSQGFYNNSNKQLKSTSNSITKFICLNIANQTEQENIRAISNRSKPYSRENMQLMNKKCRQMRSSRYGKSAGIYDIQHDNRIKRTTNLHPCQSDQLVVQFQPVNSKLQKISEKLIQKKQQSKNSKITKNLNKFSSLQAPSSSFAKSDVFIPEKQSQTGMILHQFQPNIKRRKVQDNLYVMASVLKRKLKVMQRKQVIDYVSKLMSR